MTIKSNGGIFGRNPTFNIVTADQFVGPFSGLVTSAAALKSSTTTGLMQITGPAAGQTRTMTIPDSNFTAARTDAAQSFTGNQTLTDGNLIVANGKGIDFSATAGTGTSELFDDYEEGTYTPTLTPNGSGTIAFVSGQETLAYTKVGRLVHVNGMVIVDSVSSPIGSTITVSLPFAFADLPSLSERTGGFISYFKSSYVAMPYRTTASAFELLVDASTIAAADIFRFSFSYVAG